GWLNAWTSIGPILGSMGPADTPLAGDAGADLVPRALCAREGRVDVHEKLETKKGVPTRGTTHLRLSAHLIAGRSEPIVLTTGFAGTIRITLDGQRVFEGTSDADPPPMRDEKRAMVRVERGVHRLEVLVEQATNAPTFFWLRARTPSGGTAKDLLFAQDAQTSCSATDLLTANISTRPMTDGFSLNVRPMWVGLGPLEIPDVPWRLDLAAKTDKKEKLGEPITFARGTLMKNVVGSSDGTFSIMVPLEPGGPRDVHVHLGEGLGADIVVPVVSRPNLHRRILALADKRSAIETASVSRGDKDSLLFHIDDLMDELAHAEPDSAWIKRRTEEAEALVKQLEQAKPPYEGRTGLVRRAYRSPLDGNLQPYALFVPRAYKPGGKALPLVVAAHGLGNRPEVALRVVAGEAPQGGFQGTHEARHFGGLPDFGAFVVAPWQFGNSGPRHLGEADLLRVVEEVQAHYPIAPNRISITGYSLGGTVSFVLPLHYPDVFSSSAPLCGYPNLLDWNSIRTPPHKPWEDVLIAKRYIVNWAENALHVPMFMVHGGLDEPRRSEVVAKRLQALGYAFELDVQEDLDHNVWDYGYEDGDMVRRLVGRKRPEAPEHVRFVTGEWRYDRAYWVRVLGLGALDKFADIDARCVKRDAAITVQTKYVDSFALELKQLGLKKEPTVMVNGKTIAGPFNMDTAYFVRQGSEFVLASAAPSREGKKRAGVSGPIDDMDRHSRIIVYGTQDPLQTEENRMVAEHFAGYDTFAARYPIKSDVEISDEEINAKSLVLVGNAKSNRLTALFEASLPVKFEAEAITFRGKRYEGSGVGISFIHPHPRNAQEYVVVHAGVGVSGTLASRHLPRFAPDFLVYDERITAQRGGMLLDQRPVLDGGYFDMDWK
ncbi:MAG TPA: alpha/beta hydrolase-fold protein, partial [Polyangium sp.]|nr:alpha/beta hydrolase-fold protein [Polyangium sp.]